METQLLGDQVFSGYAGDRKVWRLGLISPENKVIDLVSVGNESITTAQEWAYSEVKDFLEGEGASYCGADLVRRDVQSFLGINALKNWHCFRFAWGDRSPHEMEANSPDGKDLKWNLFFCANGRSETLLSGSLPEDWWSIDPEERDWRIESR